MQQHRLISSNYYFMVIKTAGNTTLTKLGYNDCAADHGYTSHTENISIAPVCVSSTSKRTSLPARPTHAAQQEAWREELRTDFFPSL